MELFFVNKFGIVFIHFLRIRGIRFKKYIFFTKIKGSMGYVVFPSVSLSGIYALYGLLDPISLVIVPLVCIIIG